MVLEQVLFAVDLPKSQFSFRSLGDLVGYFKHLSGNKTKKSKNRSTFSNANDSQKMQKMSLSNDQTIPNDEQTTFQDTDSVVLSGLRQTRGSHPIECTFGDSLLVGSHLGKSSLFIDKYLDCSIPDIQLEFLFESQGIADYSAYLDPSREFKHCICSNSELSASSEDIISELFIPNVKGDHFNPYIRF